MTLKTTLSPDRSTSPCVILAGGASRRFGSNKALATFRGARLIDVVVGQIERQTSGPIAINTFERESFTHVSQAIIPDELPGSLGPLAGIHTALKWAKTAGFKQVVTTPVDTPILPNDFMSKLEVTGAPCIAKCGDRVHSVHGIWPTALADELFEEISNGLRAVHKWTAQIGAAECAFPDDDPIGTFFNVNTPEDLSKLERTTKMLDH